MYDFKKRLKSLVFWTVVLYVIGFIASFFLDSEKEFIERFTSTYPIIGLVAGVLLGLFTFFNAKTSYKESGGNFSGTTQGGDKMDQHYNARFITEKELETNPKFTMQ